MKFTLSWLKTHLETDAPLQAIAEKLSMIGLEVEAVEDRASALAPFVVGYVKEARPHPNADRLKLCLVETGSGEVQVVCGGPNARTGMKGVFAPAGSYIPGTELTLKKGVIRGEESNGMLLSEREVGLSDEHEGIIELDPEAPVGAGFAATAGPRRPGDRHRHHTEPGRLPGRARRRSGPGGCRPRPAEALRRCRAWPRPARAL